LPASEPSADQIADRDRLAAAVREAGAVAMTFFRGSLKTWTKAGDSPVSEADIAANDLLRARLPRDGDGWLSEESDNDPARLQARRVWVVDPIDGTRAYIAGREDWSVSVALVEAGRPVIAAVFAPVPGQMYLAIAGHGATRDGVPIQVSAGSALDGVRLGGPKRMIERIAQRYPKVVAMPRVHSLALRLVRVAEAELDGAIAGGNACDWDLAAADLLVHEAGGAMTALDGAPLRYNQPEPVHGVLVAAGRARQAALVDLVRAQLSEPR
jgi:myo-inositol-1(or 4)-monophosphatase